MDVRHQFCSLVRPKVTSLYLRNPNMPSVTKGFLPSSQEEDKPFPWLPILPHALCGRDKFGLGYHFTIPRGPGQLLTQVHPPILRKHTPRLPMTLCWRQMGHPFPLSYNKHICQQHLRLAVGSIFIMPDSGKQVNNPEDPENTKSKTKKIKKNYPSSSKNKNKAHILTEWGNSFLREDVFTSI